MPPQGITRASRKSFERTATLILRIGAQYSAHKPLRLRFHLCEDLESVRQLARGLHIGGNGFPQRCGSVLQVVGSFNV